jgi:hypothetical protein
MPWDLVLANALMVFGLVWAFVLLCIAVWFVIIRP